MSFIISDFKKEDLEQVVEIENKVFPTPWSRDGFLDLVGKKEFGFIVAKDGERVVGYAVYHRLKEEFDLHNLTVHEDYRRLGLGTLLLKSILDEAREMGAPEIFLQVRLSNSPAQNLYRKFGFKIIGNRRHYFEDNDEDALVMKRPVLEIK